MVHRALRRIVAHPVTTPSEPSKHPFQPASELAAVITAARPLSVQKREVNIERALARSPLQGEGAASLGGNACQLFARYFERAARDEAGNFIKAARSFRNVDRTQDRLESRFDGCVGTWGAKIAIEIDPGDRRDREASPMIISIERPPATATDGPVWIELSRCFLIDASQRHVVELFVRRLFLIEILL